MINNHGTITALVAHDAGAANHIISWLKTGYLDMDSTKICFFGPAKKLLLSYFPKILPVPLNEVLDAADMLICGTGWASDIEYEMIEKGLNKNIKTVAVFDHWTNYKERLIRNGKEVHPHEIWVVDDYAYSLAKKMTPNSTVKLKRNDFISLQGKEVQQYHRTESSYVRVLYLMEPFRKKWQADEVLSGEFQAFSYFMENIKSLNLGDNIEITIKTHPSDHQGKYNSLKTSEYHNVHIKIDEKTVLAELLQWSDVVVGCQTYAMVVAISLGKKVISSLPPYAEKCVIPYKEIIHLSELAPSNEIL